MKIGFTGTRNGMNEIQAKTLVQLFTGFREFDKKITEFYLGDCVGADMQSGHLIFKHAKNPFKCYLLPCDITALQGHLEKQYPSCIRLPEKPPLERNEDLVRPIEVLFATPKEHEEQIRSGTWHTIRQAKKQGKDIYIIYPDGTVRYTDHYGVKYDVTPTTCPSCKGFNFHQVQDNQLPILECDDCKERWLSD